jgi:copper transport protein
VVAAFSPAFSGHAASAPTLRTLAIATDGLHVLAASSWLGTLSIVLIAGLGAATRQAPGTRGPLVRSLINAYSPLALASAGVAAATGVFAAWLHVGAVPNLWSTRYGIILLGKLAILGIVALTGFYNWRVVRPRLGADEATTRLQRSARVEVAVAVLVLLVTAVLVATPPSLDAAM